METPTEARLREMTDALVREVSPRRVLLFGSHARGTAGPDSDVDLLVVEDEPFGTMRSRRREMTRLWRLLARFAFPKDILVYSAEEFERFRRWGGHVVAEAVREGRVLYERG